MFGRLGGVLEGLGTSCAVSSGRLGVDLGLQGVSGHLVASWSVLGRPGGVLGHLGSVLRRLRASWGSVFVRLGGVLGRLEPFSACPGTVSGTSWH